MQISDKLSVQYILQYLKINNIDNIVLCPGSRNAPFIVSLAEDKYFKVFSIVDERTAGFVALGIARNVTKPVAVICTSGSAVLNLAPAILEAYNQDVPLLVLTADRPLKDIDTGENQTFKQASVFNNYIKYQEIINEQESISTIESKLNDIHKYLFSSLYLGPVHINFHFTEPLYNKVKVLENTLSKDNLTIDNQLNVNIEFKNLKYSKVLIYISSVRFQVDEIELLEQLIQDKNVVVFSEITSNIMGEGIYHNIDLIIDKVSEIDYPDCFITIGGHMISKKIRTFLKNNPQIAHIDIHTQPRHWNFFSNNFTEIISDNRSAIKALNSNLKQNETSFVSSWRNLSEHSISYQKSFLERAIYSEFHICNQLIQCFKPNSKVFWGNSSMIRYANWSLWNENPTLHHYANRGVSGIEGVLATAIGYQWSDKSQKVYCVLGDLSALYESNSFWAGTQLEDITILVFNNYGGQIFNNINKNLTECEQKLISTPHNFTLSNISQMYDYQYIKIDNLNEFTSNIKSYLNLKGRIIIEIFFNERSHLEWNSYFEQFKM